jgi:tripartite-type tricarboxylate transporter receptor subunit TctC
MKTLRQSMAAIAAALILPAGAGPAVAQSDDMLDLATIVVAFPPGGGADTVGRLLADALTGTYAESVVVENRPGAAGRVGAVYLRDKPTDGSWLMTMPAFPLIIHPHTYDDVPYDTLTDFTPVTSTHFTPMALAIGPAVPEDVQGLEQFVEWAKANPDMSTFGAPVGGSHHFIGIMLGRDAGFDFEIIAYPGGGPYLVDVQGGHIPAIIAPIQEVLPLHQDGRLRILALSSEERIPMAPELPTFTELGYPEIVLADWSGIFMPKDSPPEAVARLNAAIHAAIESDQVSETMDQLGLNRLYQSPGEFAELVETTWGRYRDLVAETGFSADQ